MLTIAIAWIVIAPIAPFYQHKGMSKSLYERLGYGEAFFLVLFDTFGSMVNRLLLFQKKHTKGFE